MWWNTHINDDFTDLNQIWYVGVICLQGVPYFKVTLNS